MLERIQKIISAAGVASRRAAEQLILDGRVRVNGKVVTELGTKADAVKDHIKVDGKLINPHQPMTYIMLNKPAGYVTTMSDPEGRPTVQDLLKGIKIRVYPVGRLDYNTEGLLLLTNDGDFAHLVTHPRHEFPKTYRAKVKGVLEDRQIDELEQGIYLDDGKTAPAKVKKLSKEEANSWLEITIHEGRKRQVRRMFDRVGHSVIKLKRVKTGNLMLGDLPEGSFRYLTPDEVRSTKELAGREQETVRSSPNRDFRGQAPFGVRSRETEGRSKKTEDRRRDRAEGRGHGTEVRRQKTGVRSSEFGVRIQKAEERRPGPGFRGQRAEARSQRTEVRSSEFGVRKHRGQGARGKGPREAAGSGWSGSSTIRPYETGSRETGGGKRKSIAGSRWSAAKGRETEGGTRQASVVNRKPAIKGWGKEVGKRPSEARGRGDRWGTKSEARGTRDEGRKSVPQSRVPGRGASGRGPRHTPRRPLR